MLIKITAISIVIAIAFRWIAIRYLKSLNSLGIFRLKVGEYTKSEAVIFLLYGLSYMFAFAMVVIAVIYSILKYL